MDQTLLQKIDDLERAHQAIKYGWFEWAEKHPEKVTNRGIGSRNNSQTVEFMKKEGSPFSSEFTKTLNLIIGYIRAIQDQKERYQIYRELYYIHPSFHERCLFFDTHLELDAKKIVNGRGGFQQFLDKPERDPSDLQRITTYSLRRLILIENLLSNYLDVSLFDVEPIPDGEISQMKDKFEGFYRMSLDKKVALMPDIFSILLTLLEKSNDASLKPEILLSNPGWFHWAACSINEGPIFKRISPKTRIEIFSNIKASTQDEFFNELAKHYEIQFILSEKIDISSRILSEKIEDEEGKSENRGVRKNIQYSEDFHFKMAQQNGVNEIFEYLISECKTRFPQHSIMGNSINFQVQNVLGFPKLDAFNLFPRHSNKETGLKFQAYTFALSEYFDNPISQFVEALPPGSKEWHWQGKTTKDAFGYQGYFHSLEEAKRFIQATSGQRAANQMDRDR